MAFARFPSLRTLKKLWPYMWPANRWDLKVRIIGAMFSVIASKFVILGIPFLLKWVTESLIEQSTASKTTSYLTIGIVILITSYGTMRVVNLISNHIRDFLYVEIGQGATCTLYHQVVSHVYKLSQRFHINYKVGKLSSAISNGIRSIEMIIRIIVVHLIPTILEFAISMAFLWYSYGDIYVSIMAVTVILYVWFTIITSNWRVGLSKKMNNLLHECHAKVFDTLINFETIQYFNSEKFEINRLEKYISKYKESAISVATSLGWLNFGQGLIFSIGMVITMIISSHAVYIGEQTVGDFVFINTLLTQLAIPLNILGTIYRDSRQSFIEIEELLNILNEKIEIQNAVNSKDLKIKNGHIVFNNVSFSYNHHNCIFKGISFEIAPSKKTALIGESGVGKSTVAKLLYRLYDIKGGIITIDGQDIKKITKESLRQTIGIIPQDTILFNDTLRYNILYGNPNASDQELCAAVEVAQLKSFIMKLPNGYDTVVGERGLKLSGGEKQRVSIARAILKNPPIIIFDEATSSLDIITERHIQTALATLSKNRTTLVIAHRLSTITDADNIIVFDQGTVVESGSHENLISQGGIYTSMWKKQCESIK
ncbi:ABC transporter ATP-binding protein/permease [Candidatus Liberibacter asiaticus]|uniref:ABC transporter related protein n=3 Tax=Liberibacter asiaticus TaxID=34021 RepID=C6XF96_LIBAP|nr:ABC transporter ATP-binding protein/permease [Candidatus Liberibacter asiaticus]ACT57049.1 ABC transporter related protein [Candidatus Liberibacter asiaticus str. psy62]AGH16986.1 ABC transporter-like protein [Candidatus Liberibacter asiaticus str. gxpsy]ALK07321.1 ATP-binding cassette domain-containing protein [Candidatus Liberibacter asiaticus]ASK52812.1 metal ABC transporter permease [Candidatus Liberibacter asiaticus]AWL14129.1 ABC transporter ATP-binding protein/permease [Candidatus Li